MNYRIVITKREPNPNYAAQVEEIEKARGPYYNHERMNREDYPSREITTDVLVTEVTEEQYKKIQAEVIKVF